MQLSEQEMKLVRACQEARKKAYAPYSHYQVGAALLTEQGTIYTGCNIENAAYTPSNCAERTAFFKAVSEGERSFVAIAICGSPEGELVQYAAPCGVCRQVMAEFCDKDFRIILVKSDTTYQIFRFEELLPESFGPGNLEKSSKKG